MFYEWRHVSFEGRKWTYKQTDRQTTNQKRTNEFSLNTECIVVVVMTLNNQQLPVVYIQYIIFSFFLLFYFILSNKAYFRSKETESLFTQIHFNDTQEANMLTNQPLLCFVFNLTYISIKACDPVSAKVFFFRRQKMLLGPRGLVSSPLMRKKERNEDNGKQRLFLVSRNKLGQ